jgi:DNA-directed RNA polymerase subunit RPC12/RpoP
MKYKCMTCGSEINVKIGRIKKNPNRRCKECHFKQFNGKTTHADGYIIIRIGIGANKTELEHRIVMEKMIGRKLNRKEVVHHLNGNVKDNRPENLILCESAGKHTSKFHKGIIGRKREIKPIKKHGDLRDFEI